MDTKRLFIKTQTNLINWAIAVSLPIAALCLYTLFKTPTVLTSWFPALANTVILILLLRVRFKLERKVALSNLIVFGALFAYYIINFIIGIPKMKAALAMSQLGSGTPVVAFIAVIIMGYGFFIVCGYLYYKVYKATIIINRLKKEAAKDDSQ